MCFMVALCCSRSLPTTEKELFQHVATAEEQAAADEVEMARSDEENDE